NTSSNTSSSADFEFIPPPECPVFYPTEEEFSLGPLEYISKISAEEASQGVCKIEPTNALSDEQKGQNKCLRKALRLRERYMNESQQSFCETTRQFVHNIFKAQTPAESGESSPHCYSLAFLPKVSHSGSQRRPFHLALSPIRVRYQWTVDCDEPPIIGDPWSASIPPNLDYILRIEEGVVRVYKGKDDLQDGRHAPYPVTTFNHFIDDMKFLCRTITDGPLKSFCFKRLAYLSHKFQLHVLLNDLQELKAQKQ
ncbi:unnamed protein product, partial [Oppiella nova]